MSARVSQRMAAAGLPLRRALIGLALYYLITGAWTQVLVGMNSHSPVMNYPLSLAAGAIFVMGLCMALVLVLQAVAEIRGAEVQP